MMRVQLRLKASHFISLALLAFSAFSCGKKASDLEKLVGPTPQPSATPSPVAALCSAPLTGSDRSGIAAHARAEPVEARILSAAQTLGPSLRCGDTITQSTTLASDLDCRGVTGIALTFSGDGLTLDGAGHRILGDRAAIGLLIKGTHQKVKNLIVDGLSSGTGILAYDTPSLSVENNQLTRNSIGLFIYAERADVIGVSAQLNQLSCNSLTGIRTLNGPGVWVIRPTFKNNLIARTAGYALMLQGDQIAVSGSDGNRFDQSLGAFYFGGGSNRLSGVDFSDQNIQTNPVMGAIAQALRVEDSNFSVSSGASSTSDRTGIHFYDVGTAEAYGNSFQNYTNGIVLAVDATQSPSASLPVPFATADFQRNRFSSSRVSGVLIHSEDSTPLGVLTIQQNDYTHNAPGRSNQMVAGTTIGAGSQIDPAP